MAGISDPLPGFIPAARAKVVVLGSLEICSAALMNRARSLNLEHVSPLHWKGAGISRRPGSPAATEVSQLAYLRRWFFARKPDAGFVLTEFPATLLQAKVFDEWLDSRNESLSAIVAGSDAPRWAIEHYASLGFQLGSGELALA